MMSPTSAKLPYYYATPDQNGIAPESRVPTSNDAYWICDQLRTDNYQRELRWSRIYRCYKRFPPTEYSELAKKQLTTMSNVPFGQMTFEINDKKAAYIDLVTDRNTAVEIVTKLGNAKEKKEWSDLISIGWDRAIWEWDSYFYNIDQDIEEMLLFGKGIEMKVDKATWFTRSYHNSEVLIPDRTRADLSNLGEIAIKDQYTPLEFWNKIKTAKDNPDMGWNFWACLDALRYYTQYQDHKLSPTQYLAKIESGDVNFNRYYNITINVYILFVKEWNGGITKQMILQNYAPIPGKRRMSEEEYRRRAGFLFLEKDFCKDWDELIVSIHGQAGSGLWHGIKGHGEDIFPAARQYDILMNRVVDATKMNMMVALKGGNADMTRKLKQMEWGPYMVLPEDVDFTQRQLQAPIEPAITVTQSIMQDTYRGLSQYNQVKRTTQQTARESELNFAQEAKMDGTALRRYNICMTRWHYLLFRNFIQSKAGWDGHEIFKNFQAFLDSHGVPREAYQLKNIERFKSVMLPGAGSPANKVIAAQQVAQIAGAMAITEGQEEAYRDTIAALFGRDNVERYRPRRQPDIPDQARIISFENGILANPMANPENARVHPEDNHLEHFRGHFSDSMVYLDKAMAGIQQGVIDASGARDAVNSMMLRGGHMTAHIQMLASDPTKEELAKQLQEKMSILQQRTDELVGIAQEMAKAEPQGPELSEEQRKLELELAKQQIQLDTQAKKDAIKIAATAERHQQRMEIDREAAATRIAIERAKAESQNEAGKSAGAGENAG